MGRQHRNAYSPGVTATVCHQSVRFTVQPHRQCLNKGTAQIHHDEEEEEEVVEGEEEEENKQA